MSSGKAQRFVLILGGITEAMQLAGQATQIPNLTVIHSLAGRTNRIQIRTTGQITWEQRVGHFGGVAGLAEYLQRQPIDFLIDATHPFAAQISAHAVAAAAQAKIPMIRLVRPAWVQDVGDRWLEVPSLNAAVATLPTNAQRIFLSIGRQEISTFAGLRDRWFLLRMITPPPPNTPTPPGHILFAQGPFDETAERSLLLEYKIDAIVSKNSGGSGTYSKIAAARSLGLPVVMVQRPWVPDCKTVHTVAAALDWLQGHLEEN